MAAILEHRRLKIRSASSDGLNDETLILNSTKQTSSRMEAKQLVAVRRSKEVLFILLQYRAK